MNNNIGMERNVLSASETEIGQDKRGLGETIMDSAEPVPLIDEGAKVGGGAVVMHTANVQGQRLGGIAQTPSFAEQVDSGEHSGLPQEARQSLQAVFKAASSTTDASVVDETWSAYTEAVRILQRYVEYPIARGVILSLLNIVWPNQVPVKGIDNLPMNEGAVLAILPHQSHLDSLFIISALDGAAHQRKDANGNSIDPRISFIASDHLYKIGSRAANDPAAARTWMEFVGDISNVSWADVVGGFKRSCGATEAYVRGAFVKHLLGMADCYPLNRENRTEGRRQVFAPLPKLKAGGLVAIYPHGGRTRKLEIKELWSGAFDLARTADVPIVPVIIKGAMETWDPRKRPDTNREETFFHAIGKGLYQRWQGSSPMIEVAVGEPVKVISLPEDFSDEKRPHSDGERSRYPEVTKSRAKELFRELAHEETGWPLVEGLMGSAGSMVGSRSKPATSLQAASNDASGANPAVNQLGDAKRDAGSFGLRHRAQSEANENQTLLGAVEPSSMAADRSIEEKLKNA